MAHPPQDPEPSGEWPETGRHGEWEERTVRPGLTMRRRRIRKEDGRYLLFYEFDRSGPPEQEAQR